MTVKEFGTELGRNIKADLKLAWTDVKAFGSKHPYVAIDVGILAATGLFYTVLFEVLDKKGYEHCWVTKGTL